MTDQTHDTIGRNPIGMHVEKTHEDADHETTVVEILILIYLLDNDDPAVARSKGNSFRLALIKANRAAEEVDSNQVDNSTDGDNRHKPRASEAKDITEEETEQREYNCAENEGMSTLAMQSDVLYLS